MIILKNTINTQTVFINKRKDVGLKAAVQYYTKAEADEKFQPKGDYVTSEDVDSIVGSVVDEKIVPIQNEIDELETSKQDVLVSGVNIKTINNESILGSGNINTKYTAGDNISILDSEISWEAPKVQFVNNIFTDNKMLKYTTADFNGEYTEKEFPLVTTETAGLMSPEDKTNLDNLQLQVGNISAVLDNINGETI